MKRLKYISLFCCVCLLISIFSGCGVNENNTPTEPAIPIILKENIPAASVGAAYDLSALIVEEDGVEYSYVACYTDPETGKTEELKVRRGKVTPKAEADISVTVTAARGEESSSIQLVVPIRVSADIMDKLLASDGIAGQADTGVTKAVIKDSAFLQGETSTSAISVKFSNPGNGGASILNLSHYALQAYYTAQVWRNAAVTFWVYNPMAEDVQFKLYSYNPQNEQTLQWDSEKNTQVQTAQAGEWTQIAFSLYDMGITQPIVDSEHHSGVPSLQVLAHYDGSESCSIYIDSVDVVHADSVETLNTGYQETAVPSGDFSDLLKTCKVYTKDPIAKLTASSKGNGSSDAYCFGASEVAGYPSFYVEFPKVTDISGFDYLKFDVFAENCYPWVSVAVHYLDENGEIQKHGTAYDFSRDQWRTLYVNLDYLHYADLTQVVGISFMVNMDSKFVNGAFNCVYFDNISLYDYPIDEPQASPAAKEDNDIISGPFFTTNAKPNTSGVCKVAEDETGESRSDSMLMFWTNNACGYPNVYATFMFDGEQDWSEYSVLAFDTHQSNGHYWMCFEIFYLDEFGKQQTLIWYNDSIFNHWLTTNAPLNWFRAEDGSAPTVEDLQHVVGFRISADMAVQVTDEVAMIFFDNFELT